jgi:MerR family transcriptional regulator, light-induced transcriptional regulator
MVPSQSVSTGEAAKRLGVAPVTIQRWVDAGLLLAERTPGGHRRIHIAELRRLMAASRPAASSGPVANLVEALLTFQPREIKAALIAARQRAESWAATADEVASAVAELGRQWEAGSCGVFQEHGASEGLRRAAAMCAEDLMPASGAPRAALFTVVGERHTLGLSLAELVLAEAGWRAIWLGEGPPQEELHDLVDKLKPALLVVSASPTSPRKAVESYQAVLMKLAKRRHVGLVLGGAGSWSATPQAHRVVTFCELRAILDQLEKR